jgi:anti-sigma-K factor RskA
MEVWEHTVKVRQSSLWAYLVAAVCFAIALLASIVNIALLGQVRLQQREIAALSERTRTLARTLANERTGLFDLIDDRSHHYSIGNGEVVVRGSRIDLAVHELPEPPRGEVYEVWTLPKDATKYVPSPTFLPDAHGVALIFVPADAKTTSAVAVTLEPDGGSKDPTTKPLIDVAIPQQ